MPRWNLLGGGGDRHDCRYTGHADSLSPWRKRGSLDVGLESQETALREGNPVRSLLEVYICMAASSGILVVDTCPSRAASTSTAFPPDALRATLGYPTPRSEEPNRLHAVHPSHRKARCALTALGASYTTLSP